MEHERVTLILTRASPPRSGASPCRRRLPFHHRHHEKGRGRWGTRAARAPRWPVGQVALPRHDESPFGVGE
jgi:hypothetical protein